MFTTYTNFQRRFDRPTILDCHFYELTNTFSVNSDEWIVKQNSLRYICRKKRCHIISAVAESHLRKVVGTKGKEVCFFCNLMRSQGGSWNLYHSTDFEITCLAPFFKYLCSYRSDQSRLYTELLYLADQWDHDVSLGINTCINCIQCGFNHCPGLHLNDCWLCDTKTTAAKAQHRINFFLRLYLFLELFHTRSQLNGQARNDLLIIRWKKFVQWRVK
mmetsp:Transcript_36249/g.87480  ORF Transcript_36249/g.87480 Transcript_36249/m.87480 type:complete len:217 (-) Transcript_36249:1222-1872(-)